MERVIKVQDNSGKTVISNAAKYNSNSLELLIEKFGEKVLEMKDHDGETQLHLAIQDGKGDLLKLLIEKYPEIIESLLPKQTAAGHTPLHLSTGN